MGFSPFHILAYVSKGVVICLQDKGLQALGPEISTFYWVAVWQSQSKSVWHLFGVIIFSSVSVKVLPVTPLVSGIFVHRAFCTYFLRIERVVELRRFLWWTQENH